jgi:hypothetical protein
VTTGTVSLKKALALPEIVGRRWSLYLQEQQCPQKNENKLLEFPRRHRVDLAFY